MYILKCNAEFDKVYYVMLDDTLFQCKLIRTEGGSGFFPVYVLDVATKGEVRVNMRIVPMKVWEKTSERPSVLYESVDDFRNDTPITDNYGATFNRYNSPFIGQLFKNCTVCDVEGGIIAWQYIGCRGTKVSLPEDGVRWTLDRDGFHCDIDDTPGIYRTKEECEDANKINIVTFE